MEEYLKELKETLRRVQIDVKKFSCFNISQEKLRRGRPPKCGEQVVPEKRGRGRPRKFYLGPLVGFDQRLHYKMTDDGDNVCCDLCEGQIFTDREGLKCANCFSSLHARCAGYSEINVRKMSKIARDRWRCQSCRYGIPKTISTCNESQSTRLRKVSDNYAEGEQEEEKLPFPGTSAGLGKIQTSPESQYLLQTLPKDVYFRKSCISDNGYGIWSNRKISKGVKFGPYEGIISYSQSENHKSENCSQVLEDGCSAAYLVNAAKKSKSNWLGYINFAFYQGQQNVKILQVNGQIYYEILADIPPDKELLAWFQNESTFEIGNIESTNGEEKTSNESDLCEKKPLNDTLTKHEDEQMEEKSSYICDICKKKFSKDKYLKTHQKIHTKGKPFIHSVYGKKFSKKINMQKYQFIHNVEKRYICDVCGKKFAQNIIFKLHQCMHTGEKSYICEMCGKRFLYFSNLKIHQRTHSKEKPIHQCTHSKEKTCIYICNLCGERFADVTSLKLHQFTHRTKIMYVQ